MKNSTIDIVFSVYKETWQPGSFQISQTGITALWLQQGTLTCNNVPVEAGAGISPEHGANISVGSPCDVVRFSIQQTHANFANACCADSREVLSKTQSCDAGEWLFRLDRVDFPPGAIAWRHTHPGPGIRYAISGKLTIESSHTTECFSEGQAWFEDADSPVKATADNTLPSGFVRVMLLPVTWLGKPTFTLHDNNDAHKPRLQTNIRYVDKLLQL